VLAFLLSIATAIAIGFSLLAVFAQQLHFSDFYSAAAMEANEPTDRAVRRVGQVGVRAIGSLGPTAVLPLIATNVAWAILCWSSILARRNRANDPT
jgi:hypothetical protein